MPLKKAVSRLFVKAEAFFGDSEQASVRFDTSKGSDGAVAVRDEQNGIDMMELRRGQVLSDELEAGGVHELTLGELSNMGANRIVVDTRANQPADPVAGTVHVVTDDGVIEQYDGSAWAEVAASKAALSAGGASELTAESLGTAETNTELFFGPDGSGGVEARSATGGATTGERALIEQNTAGEGV